MPQLTFPESLYILNESLKAYDSIYQNSGPIHINSDIIGINEKG
jgi:hypothetical protein